MRDPAGAGLSPDPLGLHTEPLGDFVSCQQPFHPRPLSLGDGAGDRVPGADPHGVLGARVAFGASAGARWPTGVASLFVVAMTLGSEKWAYLEVLHERAGISRKGSVGPQEPPRPIRSASSAGGKIATMIDSVVAAISMPVRMAADVPGGRRWPMAGRAVANRSDPITVSTPRGPVQLVRQQWHSQRAGSRWQWEWLARRGGQRDWKEASTAREAIRQATLLAPGKQPGWLTAAVEGAERGLSAQPAEPPADPPASEDTG